MEPAAARRRPTDVVAGARPGPVSLVEVAASGTAARGGRRRPWSSVSRRWRPPVPRRALKFCLRLRCSFCVLCTMLLSVALAAPALDEDGCDSTCAGLQRSEDGRCASRLSNCASPAAETDLRRGVLQGRRAPVACKSSPGSSSWRNLKNFGQPALRDGYITKQQIAKNSGG